MQEAASLGGQSPVLGESMPTFLPDLTVEGIMRLIPHRYPMLLVDRMTRMIAGESAVGIKNVTFNEDYFQGHFPGKPIMPGVMIVEAMAQTAGILVVASLSAALGEKVAAAPSKMVYFMTIEAARFRKPVVPGDQLELHVQKLQSRATVYKFRGEAKVAGQLHAEAEFSAMIADAKL
jgi:3-hydroxyacyl-[acyl-carrier-protein] dehydratase